MMQFILGNHRAKIGQGRRKTIFLISNILLHLATFKISKVILQEFKMTQISTAVSDFVLSVSSFYGAGVIARRYIHAAVGLLIIALAAGVGAIRFLNIAPLHRHNAVISLHTKLSWFGAILGK
jgi:hypothetical protein